MLMTTMMKMIVAIIISIFTRMSTIRNTAHLMIRTRKKKRIDTKPTHCYIMDDSIEMIMPQPTSMLHIWRDMECHNIYFRIPGPIIVSVVVMMNRMILIPPISPPQLIMMIYCWKKCIIIGLMVKLYPFLYRNWMKPRDIVHLIIPIL